MIFCEICKKNIANDEKAIKVSKKIIYKEINEPDSAWWNFKKAYICNNCLCEIQERVVRSASSEN